MPKPTKTANRKTFDEIVFQPLTRAELRELENRPPLRYYQPSKLEVIVPWVITGVLLVVAVVVATYITTWFVL